MLYWLNLILNSNQSLALFRQNQILHSIKPKNQQNYNNEDFFLQILNAWLYFTNNNFPAPKSIKKFSINPFS